MPDASPIRGEDTPPRPAPVHFERDALHDLTTSLEREWLVTNGLGGYASSTLVGLNTRRYHGLLIAADDVARRRLVFAWIDEEVAGAGVGDGPPRRLSCAEWTDGAIFPDGHRSLERFYLDGTLPVWEYRVGPSLIRKRLWLERGANTVWLRYELAEGERPVELRLRPLLTDRDIHAETVGLAQWPIELTEGPGGIEVRFRAESEPLRLATLPAARFVPEREWWWRFLHREERQRGVDYQEDLWAPGHFAATLAPGEPLTLVAAAGPLPPALAPDVSLADERARQAALLRRAAIAPADTFASRLVLAADQFLVQRAGGTTAAECAVVAGYHWFADWSRDTLIALAGLCLPTGRFDAARRLLRELAGCVERGLLPNRVPRSGELPDFGNVDGALWLFEALHRYAEASSDFALVEELLPLLDEIIDWHLRGTRHGIVADPLDGLLRSGHAAAPLTWMDARVGDWVVTPRGGKPVEVQALWYNALRHVAAWNARLGRPGRGRAERAAIARESFNARFWHTAGGYCFDVVDTTNGDDASLRPNQLLAASLTYPILDEARWPTMLEAAERALLTPFGLRTLAPGDPAYRPGYAGGLFDREAASHQGTVWAWLLGPYLDVVARVRGPAATRNAFGGLEQHIYHRGLGTIGELFSAEPPFTAEGCIAQAWSVGEVLRVRARYAEPAGKAPAIRQRTGSEPG